MNHMSEVAKMLGVELGETFTIENLDGEIMGTAVIEESRFKLIENNLKYTNFWFQYALENLLTGTYTVKRKPWKPKEGESYYIVETNGSIGVEEWWAETIDMNYYKIGNCYRTSEEAEANHEKWIAFYASDEVLEA